jgi:two-component system response regulator HydG
MLPLVVFHESQGKDMEPGRASILIIDDDPETLRFVENLVKKLGLVPYAAASCKEGLEILKEAKKIDILLCDKNLGVRDGAVCVSKAREVDPGIALIGMSGGRKGREEFRVAGAEHFLEKPFGLRDLQGIVEKILHPTP